MGNVQNARTAVEVLTASPGPVRSARTAVEVVTQQRGKLTLARTMVEALTQVPKVSLARNLVEVLAPQDQYSSEFRWGQPIFVTPPWDADMTVYLDATTSTLLQTAGGSAAVASNDPVGVWRDRVLGRDAGGAGAARPTLQKAVYNGQDALRFDGGDDQLLLAGHASEQTSNPVIFVVAKATSGGGRMMVGKSHTVSGWSSPYHRWGWYDDGSYNTSWNGAGGGAGGSWTNGDLKVLEARDGDYYANGTKVVDRASAGMAYPNGLTPILISGNGVGSERWNGDICFVGVWDKGRVMTDAEASIIRNVLGARFGVTVI
jgi:hypothetical protein